MAKARIVDTSEMPAEHDRTSPLDRNIGSPKARVMNKGKHPLDTRPEKVAIVCLGVSAKSFVLQSIGEMHGHFPFDEVWTVNRGINAFLHDKCFIMDDLRWLMKHDSHYITYIRDHDLPVITSTVYPEFPNSIAYPVQDVLKTIGDDIFAKNTVSYMVAYAIHTRVKELSIYGADFFYGGHDTREHGGQAVAYLLGMGRHFGMTHRLPSDSTLLYANELVVTPDGGAHRPFYGFHRIEQVKKEQEDALAAGQSPRLPDSTGHGGAGGPLSKEESLRQVRPGEQPSADLSKRSDLLGWRRENKEGERPGVVLETSKPYDGAGPGERGPEVAAEVQEEGRDGEHPIDGGRVP